ncbi:MAG: MBL fold metallo-hydrolase [Thermoplasmata archaeon]
MQMAPGIHRFSHGISNFYLVEEGGKLVLIDAGVAGDWGLFSTAVSSLGRNLNDLQAILLTHAHSDHTGFAERARTDAHATVWIHEADASVAKGAKQGKNEGKLGPYLRHAEAWRTLFGLIAHGGVSIVPILEVSAFADGQTLEVAGHPRVVHLPGHTPGMAALFFDARRVVFTGDALVTRNPLTGRRGPQIMPRGLNQNSPQAMNSLEKVESLAADLVLPGHGDPWTQGVADAVRRARAAGFT